MTEKMKFNCIKYGAIAGSTAMSAGCIYAVVKLFDLRKETIKSVKVLRIIAGVLVLIFAIAWLLATGIAAVLYNYEEYYCDDSFDVDYFEET